MPPSHQQIALGSFTLRGLHVDPLSHATQEALNPNQKDARTHALFDHTCMSSWCAKSTERAAATVPIHGIHTVAAVHHGPLRSTTVHHVPPRAE